MQLFWWTLLFGLASILLGAALTAIVLRGAPKKQASQTSVPWSRLFLESRFHPLKPLGDRQVHGGAHGPYPVSDAFLRDKTPAARGSAAAVKWRKYIK
jgi:hypothetical protein